MASTNTLCIFRYKTSQRSALIFRQVDNVKFDNFYFLFKIEQKDACGRHSSFINQYLHIITVYKHYNYNRGLSSLQKSLFTFSTAGKLLFHITAISHLPSVYLTYKTLICNEQKICGNKMPTRYNRGFYCLLNMFRAPLYPSSGAQEYYTVVAACGISCCGFQVAGLVWS